MEPTRPKAVLFDLDGTLIDHFNVIYRCYCHALEQLNLPTVSFAKVKASVGGSIPVTFAKLIPEHYIEEAVRLFRAHLAEIWDSEIVVLPGVQAFLERLHADGIRTAVLTNKEGEHSRQILQLIGLDTHLEFIMGTLDTLYRKPEPEFSQAALDRLGTGAEETCLIGDSPYDIAAAEAVGMIGYGVATGSHSLEELRETPAHATFPSMGALAKGVFGYDLPKDEGAVHRRDGPTVPATNER